MSYSGMIRYPIFVSRLNLRFTIKFTRSRAITDRTARCRCKFRYVSHFTAVFIATPQVQLRQLIFSAYHCKIWRSLITAIRTKIMPWKLFV